MYTRYFQVAGITLRFDSERLINETTFAEKFSHFATTGPGEDTVHLIHHFSLPAPEDYGTPIYAKAPWRIYHKDSGWIYILELHPSQEIRQICFASPDHRHLEIFNGELSALTYDQGRIQALTLMPTDQILLARLLADRRGAYFHAEGIKMASGSGLLFIGHSGAGKSTMAAQLQHRAEVLCDDRMIVRRWPEGYMLHGNWSHGSFPLVSASSAPLKAILFLEKAEVNELVPLTQRKDCITQLLGCLVKPLETKEWWEQMLTLIEDLVDTIPCYRARFDRSGDIFTCLEEL